MTQRDLYAHAKEQEAKVQLLLENLADTFRILDSVHEDGNCTSALIDYDEQDVFNALTVFYSIASNYAIKHGKLNQENVYDKINGFRLMVEDVFGVDTIKESQLSILMSQAKRCIGGKE